MNTYDGITKEEIRKGIRITKMSAPIKYVSVPGSGLDNRYPINHFPEKDYFIPEALAFADKLCPDKTAAKFNLEWNKAYCGEMDRLLNTNGLRLL